MPGIVQNRPGTQHRQRGVARIDIAKLRQGGQLRVVPRIERHRLFQRLSDRSRWRAAHQQNLSPGRPAIVAGLRLKRFQTGDKRFDGPHVAQKMRKRDGVYAVVFIGGAVPVRVVGLADLQIQVAAGGQVIRPGVPASGKAKILKQPRIQRLGVRVIQPVQTIGVVFVLRLGMRRRAGQHDDLVNPHPRDDVWVRRQIRRLLGVINGLQQLSTIAGDFQLCGDLIKSHLHPAVDPFEVATDCRQVASRRQARLAHGGRAGQSLRLNGDDHVQNQ